MPGCNLHRIEATLKMRVPVRMPEPLPVPVLVPVPVLGQVRMGTKVPLSPMSATIDWCR